MSFLKCFKRIVIAGVGLIGGSVGLALKRSGFSGEIIGFGRRLSSLTNAINVGAIDSIEMDLPKAMNCTDLLLICTPVDTISKIARDAVKYAQKGCIITDAGSTKGQLVSEIDRFVPEGVYFVGAHPMAGSHKSGVDAADASLFEKSICIITPTESTNHEAINSVSELWQIVGARVETMSPQEHDLFIAAASHLPHAVACALVNVIYGVDNGQKRAIDFAATGFADTTRVASGSPEVWKGILLQNASMVSVMLDKLEKEIADMRVILNKRDEAKIMDKLEQAKQIRDSFKR